MTTPKSDRLLGAPERRAFKCEQFELRAINDQTVTLTGYASVFEKGYEMYGGPDKGGWIEVVDRRAFDETLKRKPDLHLLINHEGMPLARTKSGTLRLSTDKVGLLVDADLDRSDPDVQRLEVKMGRGDMDEMSFAFRTIRHEWNEDESERRMLELNLDKGDVSVVNFGASPHTSAGIRSMEDAIAAITAGDLAEMRSLDPNDIRSAHEILGQLIEPSVKPGMSVAQARRLLQLTA
jgi:HK97 family phage prohead protease